MRSDDDNSTLGSESDDDSKSEDIRPCPMCKEYKSHEIGYKKSIRDAEQEIASMKEELEITNRDNERLRYDNELLKKKIDDLLDAVCEVAESKYYCRKDEGKHTQEMKKKGKYFEEQYLNHEIAV